MPRHPAAETERLPGTLRPLPAERPGPPTEKFFPLSNWRAPLDQDGKSDSDAAGKVVRSFFLHFPHQEIVE